MPKNNAFTNICCVTSIITACAGVLLGSPASIPLFGASGVALACVCGGIACQVCGNQNEQGVTPQLNQSSAFSNDEPPAYSTAITSQPRINISVIDIQPRVNYFSNNNFITRQTSDSRDTPPPPSYSSLNLQGRY
jgi:hypothetical protein